MSDFIVVKSKSKPCNCTTYIRKFKLTFLHSKRHTILFELQSRGPLRMLKVSSDSDFFNFVVPLTDWHTSHGRSTPSHGLDLPSLSN